MKFLTALLSFIIAIHANAISSITIQQGDFVKGEFTVSLQRPMDLIVRFPDQSSRRLLHNIAGSQEFMFKAEHSGKAQFIATATESEQQTKDYQIKILQHIPLEQQKALPSKQQSPIMQTLAEQLQRQKTSEARQKLIDEFWYHREKEGTPLIEPGTDKEYNLVTFLWRGAKHNVILWGAPSSDHEPLQQLMHSDIWFKTFELRKDTLIAYRFAPDVPILPLDNIQQRRALLSTLQADPLNFKTHPADTSKLDKFNYSSVLALSKAPLQPYVIAQNTVQGQLTNYSFHSKLLNNSRRISIYLPPNFEAQNPHQLLLFFFDGKDYTGQVPTPRILDNMIAAGKIPPAVAVFIDNPSSASRRTELPANPIFARMLAEELYPWVTQQLHINPLPNHIALIGSSYGGLAAAYIAGQYPHLFGNVLSMSGSFWWQQTDTPSPEKNYIATLYARMARQNIRFFLSAGRYETSTNSEFDILNNSRQLNNVLIAKGYSVFYQEYTSDHGYYAWQGILSDGLSALFEKK